MRDFLETFLSACWTQRDAGRLQRQEDARKSLEKLFAILEAIL